MQNFKPRGDLLSRVFGVGTPQQFQGEEQIFTKLRQGVIGANRVVDNVADKIKNDPIGSALTAAQTANMFIPNPLISAPIEAGIEGTRSIKEGKGLGKALAIGAVAGGLEFIPFAEILGDVSKISKKNLARLIESIAKTSRTTSKRRQFTGVLQHLLKDMDDGAIKLLTKDIETPDQAVQLLEDLGVTGTHLERAYQHLHAQFGVLEEIMAKKNNRKWLEKAGKYDKEYAKKWLQTELPKHVKGFRDRVLDSTGMFKAEL